MKLRKQIDKNQNKEKLFNLNFSHTKCNVILFSINLKNYILSVRIMSFSYPDF